MRGERLMRCAHSKKKNTPCISRPHVSKILQNRVSHLGGEGKLLTSSVFQPTDTNLLPYTQSRSSSVSLQTSPMRRPYTARSKTIARSRT